MENVYQPCEPSSGTCQTTPYLSVHSIQTNTGTEVWSAPFNLNSLLMLITTLPLFMLIINSISPSNQDWPF